MATYGSEAGVEAMIPSAGDIGLASTPTTSEVGSWLEQGYAIINRHLSGAGYIVPVVPTAAVYDEFVYLNNLWAAAQLLRALGLDVVQGEQQNRAQVWLSDFRKQLHELISGDSTGGDLTGVGVPLDPDVVINQRKRRLRTVQIRRVDGYSSAFEGVEGPEYEDQ